MYTAVPSTSARREEQQARQASSASPHRGASASGSATAAAPAANPAPPHAARHAAHEEKTLRQPPPYHSPFSSFSARATLRRALEPDLAWRLERAALLENEAAAAAALLRESGRAKPRHPAATRRPRIDAGSTAAPAAAARGSGRAADDTRGRARNQQPSPQRAPGRSRAAVPSPADRARSAHFREEGVPQECSSSGAEGEDYERDALDASFASWGQREHAASPHRRGAASRSAPRDGGGRSRGADDGAPRGRLRTEFERRAAALVQRCAPSSHRRSRHVFQAV